MADLAQKDVSAKEKQINFESDASKDPITTENDRFDGLLKSTEQALERERRSAQEGSAGGARKAVQILGTRGIPGAHGGFETFAEQLALYLVARGWDVTVYCQARGSKPVVENEWNGIRRIVVSTRSLSSAASIYFDWLTTVYASRRGELALVLGYNTAVFCGLFRLRGVPCLINMDGLEWKRKKWSWPARAWLYCNERFGCLFGNHLIADHPEIANHLTTRTSAERITTIPYGSNAVGDRPEDVLKRYDLKPHDYALVIARAEPENSLLEIVRAFSARRRNTKLFVLGRYTDRFEYQRQVQDQAGDEVIFPGAIYDREIVETLRRYASLYIHGHQVGGTNPSLVEALGAGSAVLAHDNVFNRWVAGNGASYFSTEADCAAMLDRLLDDPDELAAARKASLIRHEEEFVLTHNLARYEALLEDWLPLDDGSAETAAIVAQSPTSGSMS